LIILCFFAAPATTDISTLSLHDALPISKDWIVAVITASFIFTISCLGTDFKCSCQAHGTPGPFGQTLCRIKAAVSSTPFHSVRRSEEHTSELQSRGHLVCRLLLEKKKKT